MSHSKPTSVIKKNISFKPDGPHFPNLNSMQKSKVSFVKGKNEMKIFNHWFEHKGKKYISKEFSQQQVKDSFGN